MEPKYVTLDEVVAKYLEKEKAEPTNWGKVLAQHIYSTSADDPYGPQITEDIPCEIVEDKT